MSPQVWTATPMSDSEMFRPARSANLTAVVASRLPLCRYRLPRTHSLTKSVETLAALVVAAACSGRDLNQPMSPDGVMSANDRGSSLASFPRSGTLNIEKDCSSYALQAGDTCTITKSNLKEIGIGTTIHYLQAANPDFTVSSDVVLDPPGPGNNAAFGHCTLSLVTGIGVCMLSGGTGKFTFFQASVDVTPVGGPIYAWD